MINLYGWANFQCYYCGFRCKTEEFYLKHGAKYHLYKPLFPNQTELKELNLRPQGRKWEQPLRTEQQAIDHLADWAYRKMQEEEKERLQRGKLAYKRRLMKTVSDEPYFQRRIFTPEEINEMGMQDDYY